ncbi:MAG TPA: RecX family transcriptional regulator [Candidatus Saccharibacteria bacterium]|nr:RecX family transcriptional regulator [Candidatus Saccharibacteria bacterium]
MKITALSVQVRDKNRVNVSVDGKYRFSLDILQVASLGIKVGMELTEQELAQLEQESQYGKLYTRALEYALVRPRSRREMRDYLYRKTRDTRTKTGGIKKGISPALTERVFERLAKKGYIDDEKFAQFWVENRNVRKGSSLRKLAAELIAKGVDRTVIDEVLARTDRRDSDELQKIIMKKRAKYDDEQKLITYLARQGFGYDDIKNALNEED